MSDAELKEKIKKAVGDAELVFECKAIGHKGGTIARENVVAANRHKAGEAFMRSIPLSKWASVKRLEVQLIVGGKGRSKAMVKSPTDRGYHPPKKAKHK